MSTARESFRNDLHRDPAELENEADRARQHLEHTLEALERRFSPGEMLDQALRAVKGNGSDFGHNLLTQVRNNPVPVLLTSVGVAWLLSASNRPPQPASGPGMMERASGAASSARDAAGSARDAASSTAASARSAASRAAGTAQSMGAAARDHAASARAGATHAAQRTADATQQAARQMSYATRTGAERVYQGYDYLRREQPLVLGALAVAAGALIGALMPSTRAEDRAFGEYRDRAMEDLTDEARRRADQAGQVAADVADSAAQAARETTSASMSGDGKRPASTGGASSSSTGAAASASGATTAGGTRSASSDPNPGLP